MLLPFEPALTYCAKDYINQPTGKRPTYVCKGLSMWFAMKRTWKMKDDYVLFIHYLQFNVAVVIVHFGWDLFVAGVHVLVLVLIHLYGVGIKTTLNALYGHVSTSYIISYSAEKCVIFTSWLGSTVMHKFIVGFMLWQGWTALVWYLFLVFYTSLVSDSSFKRAVFMLPYSSC